MEKRCLISSFVIAVLLFGVITNNRLTAQNGFANYITISNGQFRDGNNIFKPLCINYIVDIACYLPDSPNKEYYIAPHFNYSDSGRTHNNTEINDSIYYGWHWGYADNGYDEKDTAEAKLNHDLKVMDSLGFNVVRIAPTVRWKNHTLQVPTGSYAKYFELMDTLIAKCMRHNLRVILVLDADSDAFRQFDQYCVYLDSVSRHFSTNKTVMAYVAFAEPGFKWKNPHENDKIMISNWSRKWYYLIKRNAPNQLVTIGLDGLNNVLFWDPSALTYDFLTMHFYYDFSDINMAKKGVHIHFKWMKENVEDIWVLGETGFVGTDTGDCHHIIGSEADQREYARFTTWLAVGCDCKGYSWWQYQNVKWGKCDQDYHGLITTYPEERFKLVANIFPISPANYIEPFSCPLPDGYYDIHNYNHSKISGVVKDEDSNQIKDAYVAAWTQTNRTYYTTFTDGQGAYSVSAPRDSTLRLVWVSQKGYTASTFNHENNDYHNTTLTHINYNKWKKNWTNVNYPIQDNYPEISSSDIVVVGNFCGDEAQELLVIRYSTGTVLLYRFHTNHWEQLWDGAIQNWQISSTDKFYAGDYNGDGYDELLCVQNTTNAWAKIYRYDSQYPNNPWNNVWTNYGNGNIGNWNYAPGDVILSGHFNDSTYCSLLCMRYLLRPAACCQRLSSNSWETTWTHTPFNGESPVGFDKYYVGDFNGDGIDELFCTQVTGGNSDLMKLLRLENFWTTQWSNNGNSDGVGIYPYRANLHVGNFDADRADELLGVGAWATKFDLNTSNQWDWSWSTYESGRLSDWEISPNHRIHFMKVMTDVPDYLLVGRRFPRDDFRFDAYSFDP